MKPAPFVYYRPETREEAVALLVEHGDEAKILAGGQSLVPMMNLRIAQPGILIDVCGVGDLAGVASNGAIEIGATTRQADVLRAKEIGDAHPILPAAMRWIGHPANRNRGTFGGSVAHADPAAELPAVLLTLGAEIVAHGPSGTRTIAIDDFFDSYLTTHLDPEELLTSVRIPKVAEPGRRAWGFLEIARRQGDFAMVGVAFTADLAADGRVADARIALLGVADKAIRVPEAEAALRGHALDEADLAAEAGALAARDLDPPFDQHASAEYRKEVAGVLVGRVIRAAADRENR